MEQQKKKAAAIAAAAILFVFVLGNEFVGGPAANASVAASGQLPAGRNGPGGLNPQATASPALATLPASMMAPREALTLQIAPTQVFTEGIPLALQVTFRNTGTSALRLPNNTGLYGDWMLRLESSTGKVLTGGVFQRNGKGTEKAPPSRAILPGATFSMTAGFEDRTFTFVDGDLTYAEFQKAVGKPAQPVAKSLPQVLKFPAGTYKATLTARFPNAVVLDPDRRPAAFRAQFPDAAVPEADTTPVWKYDALVSNTVEVTFAPLKPEEAGSITGMVVDSDGKAFPGVDIAFYRTKNFSSPPNTGSGNADSIANMPDPPTPQPLRPEGIFGGGGGGTPAGTSDADGAFAIKNLAPGTYIVTVSKSGGTGRGFGGGFRGSMQPIEVKAGSETKLDQPVKALSTLKTNRGGGQ